LAAGWKIIRQPLLVAE
jgi:predicted transcriptional regulator